MIYSQISNKTLNYMLFYCNVWLLESRLTALLGQNTLYLLSPKLCIKGGDQFPDHWVWKSKNTKKLPLKNQLAPDGPKQAHSQNNGWWHQVFQDGRFSSLFCCACVWTELSKAMCAQANYYWPIGCKFGEVRQSQGLTKKGRIIVVFASSETGTWTINVTASTGIMGLLS